MLITATECLKHPNVEINVSEKKVKVNSEYSTPIEIDFSELSEKNVEILLNSIFTLEKVMSKVSITTSSSSSLHNAIIRECEDQIIFSDSNEILGYKNIIELSKRDKRDKEVIRCIKNAQY